MAFFLAPPAVAVVALLWALALGRRIAALPAGTARMREIAAAIEEGAQAFLRRAYRTVAVFVVLLGGALLVASQAADGRIEAPTALAFVVGAAASLSAGYVGMRVAVCANVRTAEASRHSLGGGLAVAFSGGSVMGLVVCGLGLLGVSLILYGFGDPSDPHSLAIVDGFALGASSVALFARVAGGIFTKGADIGADLVGKLEAGIPEDDARNPAVIADNVGDNVGDVAGMGADLFESYVGSLVAAMAIAAATPQLGPEGILLPLLLAAAGLAACLPATAAVRSSGGRDPAASLRGATLAGGLLFLGAAWWLCAFVYGRPDLGGAVAVGLAVALALGYLTEISTGPGRPAVRSIAEAAQGGPATALIAGLAGGMASTAWPVVAVVAGVLASYELGGLYGVALAAVGMLSTTALMLAVDAYGPIADNAGGIAEMAGLPPEVRARTDLLDAVGNTTAAVGKGIAIGSAALTSLALFAAYAAEARLDTINLLTPSVITGVLAGAMLPYLFSSIVIRAVGRSAVGIVAEVRRQFKGGAVLSGARRPDYARCVDLSTGVALREMVLPGGLAVAVPLAVGLTLGKGALAGLLAGSLAAGVVLAIQMSNAGGAFDNAKKWVEQGNLGGPGTAAHAAAVVGDTVGDPLKDAAGPSLNILIKLMSIVALVFVPLFH